MQDASWRELIKFCAARGAYRGAGAEHMRSLLRTGSADDDKLFGEGVVQQLLLLQCAGSVIVARNCSDLAGQGASIMLSGAVLLDMQVLRALRTAGPTET